MSDVNYVEFLPLTAMDIAEKCTTTKFGRDVGEYKSVLELSLRASLGLGDWSTHECFRTPVWHTLSAGRSSVTSFHRDHHQFGTYGWLFMWSNILPTEIVPVDDHYATPKPLTPGVLVAINNNEWLHRQPRIPKDQREKRYFYRFTVTHDLTPEQIAQIGQTIYETFTGA